MKINHLDVERYGIWSNMQLGNLSDGLNVVYGPNGSGKTTLVEFVRSVLYGQPVRNSARFIPAVHNGSQGGSIGLTGSAGPFKVSRFSDGDRSGTLSVDSHASNADGFERMLADVGEAAFCDLFTVGYREADSFDVLVREALSDTGRHVVESAEKQEVAVAKRRIADEKRRLLDSSGRSRIQQLSEEREQLVAEIQRIGQGITVPGSLSELRQRLAGLDRQIAELEARIAQLDQAIRDYRAEPARVIETRCQPAMPENTTVATDVSRLDQEILKWRRRCRELDEDIVGVKQQIEALHVRDGQSQESPRVSQIGRTRDCVQQLKQQVRQLENLTAPDRNVHETSWKNEVDQLRNQVFELCREIGRDETEERQRSLDGEIVQLRRCQEEMHRQIRILTRRRDVLVQNYGIEDREFLRRAVTNVCDCADAESYVPNVVERPVVEAAPNTDALDRMRREREALIQQLNQLRQERERLAAELLRLETELSASPDERRIERLQLDLNIVNENLRKATQRWQTLSASESILNQLSDKYEDQHEPLILKEASEYLSRLTNAEYPSITADATKQTLLVTRANDGPLALNGLSRGTRDQVALSLRLAVANAYARRGHQLPIILDDVFLTSDDDRAEAIALLLRDYAAGGRQIIFFTCSEQHADLFRSIGVQVRNLPDNRPAVQPIAQSAVQPIASPIVIQPVVTQPVAPVVQPPTVVPRVESPTAVQPLLNAPPIVTPLNPDSSLVIKAFAAEAGELEDRSVIDTDGHSTPFQTTNDAVDGNWIFYLEVESSIDELPGIGTDEADELQTISVSTVEDLLALVPDAAAVRLSHAGITADQIRVWQSQAMLSCRIPMLRTRDAWLLVNCRLTNPEQLSRMHPEELYAVVERYLKTPDGRSFVRKNNPFDLQTAINWIRWSRHARNLWDSRAKPSSGQPGFTATQARRTRKDSGQRSDNGNGQNSRPLSGTRKSGNSNSNSNTNSGNGASGGSGLYSGTAGQAQSRQSSNRSDSKSRGNSKSSSSRKGSRRSTERAEKTGRTFDRNGLSTTRSNDKSARTWKYYLEKSSPVEDAPSIGAKTADRLSKAGIFTVRDLLEANCESVAKKVNHRRLTAKTLKIWQNQARMVCQIPQLRGHDAQILVACEVEDPQTLASMRPNDLFAKVMPFTQTSEGERIIRGGKKPDLAEIQDWIEWASHARDIKAA